MTTAQSIEKTREVLEDQLHVKKVNDRKIYVTSQGRKSSEQEHRVDAKAPSAEEGRGKLRKAMGSRKQAKIRRYPNGETRQIEDLSQMGE